MVQQFKAMNNPQALLQSMPQYKEAVEYVNANGGDPKTAFYKYAEENGIDADVILNMFK